MTLGRWIRIAAKCEAALLTVLALSGLYLAWFYRPTGVRVYAFGDSSGLQASIRFINGVRALHVVASIGFIWIGVGLAGMCIAGAVRGHAPTRHVAVGAAGFAVVGLAASFTGYLLPWDQLALRAVTMGSNVRGLWQAAFSDQILFVLIGSREISQATLRNWFLVHSFALSPLLAAGLFRLFFYKATPDDSAVGTRPH